MARGFSIYEDIELSEVVLACRVDDRNLDWLSRVTASPIVIPNTLEWPVPRRAIYLNGTDYAYVGDYIINNLNATFTKIDEGTFNTAYREGSV